MLKFLTHKLRTHSLNEDNVPEKIDEHDSGTESDEEIIEHPSSSNNNSESTMKWQDVTDISMSGIENACTPQYNRTPAEDYLYDHHSSEEELEVINGAPRDSYVSGARRAASSAAGSAPPEKRKWSQSCENDENAAASEDEGHARLETPVRFRTSPPIEALKPRRGIRGRHRAPSPLALHNSCGCPAPAKLPHLATSSSERPSTPPVEQRKRSRHMQRRHPQRPCLDFDKMQQLKVRTATAWRHHGAEHGGELSVFCW